jgi:hypothetical protein
MNTNNLPASSGLKAGDLCIALPHPFCSPELAGETCLLLEFSDCLVYSGITKQNHRIFSWCVFWKSGRLKGRRFSNTGKNFVWPACALIKLPGEEDREQFNREIERPQEKTT